MKKFLSTLLAFALTFGCCEPCLAYDSLVEPLQPKSVQEKEIERIKKKLKKQAKNQFKEIDKIKHMSKPRYFLYKIGKYLGDFLLVVLGVGLTSAAGYFYRKKEDENLAQENYQAGYNNGYFNGFEKGKRESCTKSQGSWDPSVEANIKNFFDQTKRVLSFEAFKRTYKRFFKDGSNADKFYKESGMENICKLANNILDEMNTIKSQKNQHQNFDYSEPFNFFKDLFKHFNFHF